MRETVREWSLRLQHIERCRTERQLTRSWLGCEWRLRRRVLWEEGGLKGFVVVLRGVLCGPVVPIERMMRRLLPILLVPINRWCVLLRLDFHMRPLRPPVLLWR